MGTLGSAIEADRSKRRAKAERAAAGPPPQEIVARNGCIAALAELPDPRRALAVIKSVEKSILEYLAVQARG